MFNRFFEQHSLNEYNFSPLSFPTVEDRDFWDAFPNEECVTKAERELDYSWPIIRATSFMAFKTSGDRVVMENAYHNRRHHLNMFIFAELKENKGRFLPQIVDGLFATCEESFWGLSAHYMDKTYSFPYIPSPEYPYIDLCVAETAEQLVLCITLLRKSLDAFCPEIIDRVLYELNRRVKAPYETRLDFAWMGHGHRTPNNWTVWILSRVLTVFLLAETEERRKQRAIRKIMLESQLYYDALPDDGGCDEGVGYWSMAGASLFEIVYQLKCATNGALDLFDDVKLGRIAAYMKKMHLAKNAFVTVSDSGPQEILGGLLYIFARETKQPDLMNFAAALYQNVNDPMKLIGQAFFCRTFYLTESVREMERFTVTYPIHDDVEYLPDLQTAAIRNKDLCLFAKGGHNDEQHNHNDVGSFLFYDGITPVLVDTGINTYTRFTFEPLTRYTMIPWTRSMNHNAPLINNTEQREGKEFCADRFDVSNGRIEISFAGAYPIQAGAKNVVRELTLRENGFTCADRFDFADASKTSVTEVLMSVLPVRVENNAAILGDRYRISANVGTLTTEYLPFEDAKMENAWKCDGVTRILFSFENVESIEITLEKI